MSNGKIEGELHTEAKLQILPSDIYVEILSIDFSKSDILSSDFNSTVMPTPTLMALSPVNIFNKLTIVSL